MLQREGPETSHLAPHGTPPFVTGHFHPLIPHAADNGFPSDHALLAAALVAAVLLARIPWAAPFVFMTALVEWARVGTGVHHPVDVLGSDALITLGAVIGLAVAPVMTGIVLPYIPRRILDVVAAPDKQPPGRAG